MPKVSFKTRIKLSYDLLQRVSNDDFLTYRQVLKGLEIRHARREVSGIILY